MTRRTAETLFKSGIGQLDKLAEERGDQADKALWKPLRDLIASFFVLGCDAVYGEGKDD